MRTQYVSLLTLYGQCTIKRIATHECVTSYSYCYLRLNGELKVAMLNKRPSYVVNQKRNLVRCGLSVLYRDWCGQA